MVLYRGCNRRSRRRFRIIVSCLILFMCGFTSYLFYIHFRLVTVTPKISSPTLKSAGDDVKLKTYLQLWRYKKLIQHHCPNFKNDTSYYFTINFSGGLGNHMFQYSFLYSVSKIFKARMMVSESQPLFSAFDLKPKRNFTLTRLLQNGCAATVEDQYDCAYDASIFLKLQRFTMFEGYFQSWRYFTNFTDTIRETFRFNSNVQLRAQNLMYKIFKKIGNGANPGHVTVGVHVRRGDKVSDKNQSKFGHQVAGKDYLENAMKYFRERYSNVVFVFSSDDRKWTRAFLKGKTNVYLIAAKSPEVDMATLSMTDHSIITVGTFGWWIAFLTNGRTIYYKHPYRLNSSLEKEFNGKIDDFYPPDWIGMD